MKYLFLFDIDGTILQVRSGKSAEIFLETLSKFAGKEMSTDNAPSFAGMVDLGIVRKLCEINMVDFAEIEPRLPDLWRDLLAAFSKIYTLEYVKILPGIVDLLEKLKSNPDVALGLLTGNFIENAHLKLSSFDLLKYFPFGAFGSDAAERNDLPRVALDRANQFFGGDIFRENNSLIIGDSPRDYECAKANSIKSALVTTGHFSREELAALKPDALFNDLADYEKAAQTMLNLFK